MQDPAIQPPEALKVQLGEIYQFIYEDESLANRGCRDVWSDLMQLGVKDSLIADFDTFNSTELKQTFDRSSCESILLDGFQKNKSFLEVAEALNSQCADSLELFVFHCFASAEANAFAVANVSGGTRNLRGVTATARGMDHQEWNELDSGLGDHLVPTMAHELPATGHDASARDSIRSDSNHTSAHLSRDINRDESPLIEFSRDKSGVGDGPASEGNKRGLNADTAEEIRNKINKLSEILQTDYLILDNLSVHKRAYQETKEYAQSAVKAIQEAEGFEERLRLEFSRINTMLSSLSIVSQFPERLIVDDLREDADLHIQRAAKYINFARDIAIIATDIQDERAIQQFIDIQRRLSWRMDQFRDIKNDKLIDSAKDAKALYKDRREYNIDVINRNLSDFARDRGWGTGSTIDRFITSLSEYNERISKAFSDADIRQDQEGIDNFLNYMKRVNYVIESDRDMAQRMANFANQFLIDEDRLRGFYRDLDERVDTYYASFMAWWTNCWLYKLFT